MGVTREEKRALVWLSMAVDLKPQLKTQLLKEAGSAAALYEDLPLFRPMIPEGAYDVMASSHFDDKIDEVLIQVRNLGARLLYQDSEEYPLRLQAIADAPTLLYKIGSVSPNQRYMVSVVGSRKATPYGIEMAQRIGEYLAKAGVSVVSGMALGIDCAAQRACLKAGGIAFSVLAGGVEDVYPQTNRDLYDAQLKNGAILSEYPPGTRVAKRRFPIRNRIISGMGEAVILVEAAKKSGAAITAKLADEQGKDVIVVPGALTQAQSYHPNHRARDGAPILVELEDILYTLGGQQLLKLTQEKAEVKSLSPPESAVVNEVSSGDTSFDMLVEKLKLSASALNSILTTLEMREIIVQMPGRIFRMK